MTEPAPVLTIQGRPVDLSAVTGLVIRLGHATQIQLSGVDARFAVRALLRGEDPLPNTSPLPPHPVLLDAGDTLIGDVLFCTNPAFEEHWILVDTSGFNLGILMEGRRGKAREECTRSQWRSTTQDWHRACPSLEWLAERGVAPQLLDRVRAARAAENPHANNAPEGL